MTRPIIDAHLDLSWNALSFDRDLTLTLDELRQREQHVKDSGARGNATVNFDQMKTGNISLCFGTLLARAMPKKKPSTQIETNIAQVNQQLIKLPTNGAHRIDLDFGSPDIAHSVACGQLGWYHLMQQRGYLQIITNQRELGTYWNKFPERSNIFSLPIGMILSMEGADPITEPEELEFWWNKGLRALGPVHYGQNRYAVGTGFDGPLTNDGIILLQECERLGVIVDVTHLSDTSMAQTLDNFGGRVIASHHNCRALVPKDRQLTDKQIKTLISRDAVIGTVLDNWMLNPDWQIGKSKPDKITLENAVDHIDHICQIAGNTRHCAIGSDLDGGFGNEQTPKDLNTIADLQKLEPILSNRGYSNDDINAIFYNNWLRLLRESLPK